MNQANQQSHNKTYFLSCTLLTCLSMASLMSCSPTKLKSASTISATASHITTPSVTTNEPEQPNIIAPKLSCEFSASKTELNLGDQTHFTFKSSFEMKSDYKLMDLYRAFESRKIAYQAPVNTSGMIGMAAPSAVNCAHYGTYKLGSGLCV